jgi:hypothetical protein
MIALGSSLACVERFVAVRVGCPVSSTRRQPMALSKAQEKAFEKWLASHGVRPKCAACGTESGWMVHNEILSAMVLDLDHKKISPSTAGFFVLVCKHCKHAMFFAAAPILQG